MEDPEIEGFMRGATSEEEDEATGVAGTTTLSGGPIAIRLESYRTTRKRNLRRRERDGPATTGEAGADPVAPRSVRDLFLLGSFDGKSGLSETGDLPRFERVVGGCGVGSILLEWLHLTCVEMHLTQRISAGSIWQSTPTLSHASQAMT